MSFTGFPPAGRALLARLPGLDPAGFAAEHTAWTTLLLDPARGFVTALGAVLVERISPGLLADPRVNGSIAPINRDLRFDPHGPRYKDHLLFRWWERDRPKRTAPTLFVRLDPTRIGYASGMVFPSTDQWRTAVADHTTAQGLINRVRRDLPDAEIAGADLKRVPAPYPADHPNADLLRHKTMFQLRWTQPLPTAVSTPAFVEHCATQLARLTALHHWLHTTVATVAP
ncbi:DUF2461 family protein [Actinophytocola sp.]|uniref:DUF2461 family protein n=1 Tax=Actinophytocola sp. TaxID=1872138 RepID=UPI002D80CA3E|nr:DUF2461 family protein [Actinophytocola sp.]HET9143418.1 DUF2461 family protein [Actinophytocola sp.]